MIPTLLANFFHLAGLIIGLGAVTVIDALGFTARKSVEKTQVTIAAHHITKPLIWIGTTLLTLSWIVLYDGSFYARVKTLLLAILVLNGLFLSLYVSPRLDQHIGKKKVLPATLQQKIIVSAVVSFIAWWSFVIFTVL